MKTLLNSLFCLMLALAFAGCGPSKGIGAKDAEGNALGECQSGIKVCSFNTMNDNPIQVQLVSGNFADQTFEVSMCSSAQGCIPWDTLTCNQNVCSSSRMGQDYSPQQGGGGYIFSIEYSYWQLGSTTLTIQ